jgi:hypothetical protein
LGEREASKKARRMSKKARRPPLAREMRRHAVEARATASAAPQRREREFEHREGKGHLPHVMFIGTRHTPITTRPPTPAVRQDRIILCDSVLEKKEKKKKLLEC